MKSCASSRLLDVSNYSAQSSFGSLKVQRCVVCAGAWTQEPVGQLFLLGDGSEFVPDQTA